MGAQGSKESAASRAFDYDRTVALSDGVFAIALTLLVLTIDFPNLHGTAVGQLGQALHHRVPQVLTYALSFAVLGYLWLRHHAFFGEINGVDARLAVLNLVYLALVAFLPYPTRLLGVYGSETVSVVSYAATIVVLSLVGSAMRLHAERHQLISGGTLESWFHQMAAPAIFAISIPVALLMGSTAGELTWILLLVIRPALRVGGPREA